MPAHSRKDAFCLFVCFTICLFRISQDYSYFFAVGVFSHGWAQIIKIVIKVLFLGITKC